MSRIRLLLTAVALSFAGLLTLSPPASADNCDIFINPEDCQNTGWTIGVIATLTGGVAVATAATIASVRSPTPPPQNRPAAPIPPPPLPPLAPPAARPPAGRRDDRQHIEGVEVRPIYDPPTTAIHPQDGAVRAHSVRLEVHRDLGSQTVEEAPQ